MDGAVAYELSSGRVGIKVGTWVWLAGAAEASAGRNSGTGRSCKDLKGNII